MSEIELLGLLDTKGFEQDNRIYGGGGICPCLRAENATVNVLVEVGYEFGEMERCRRVRGQVSSVEFNGVIEKMDEVKVIGQMDNTLDGTFESANRVYDKEGLCPTIPTCAGGGIQPKVIDEKQNFVSDGNGGITTGCSPEIKADETIKTIGAVYRIRKLTPTECGRLMGVDDCDIEKMKKVNSNSQLYKQFGNSIVVDVMCAMFRQLNLDGIPKWNKE